MSTALLLGAGFPKWAVGLPVARQLFDFTIEPWGLREGAKLNKVRRLKETWNQNHADGLAEQFVADALAFSDKEREAVLWYLTRRLSEPFIWREFHAQKWRRHVLMIDENRKFGITGIKEAQTFLRLVANAKLAGIVTTNYDLVVEYALGTKGFNYGVPGQILFGRGPYPVSQWRNPVTLTGNVPVAKIHGSISWDERGCYTDGRRGLTGHALIVAPTPDKNRPVSLEFAWQVAEQILERATYLIVFGFAFNPYDEAVLNLLRLSGSHLESVLLIDVDPKIERAGKSWPRAILCGSLPPAEGTGDIERWLAGRLSVDA